MRYALGRFTMRSALMAALSVVFAACGGGGGSTGGSAVVPNRPPLTTSAVTLTGTINGTGPYVLAATRRTAGARHAASTGPSFDHIDVKGTLYASDASAASITNTVTIPPPGGNVYTASVGFSNVVSGNNEWALLEFTGVAADGSRLALGEVGGLVNVGANATTATLNATTTATLQVFVTLLAGGLISTYDIDNVSNLSDAIVSQLSTTGVTTDPATGVYTTGSMQKLYNVLGPLYQRTVTVSTVPSTPGSFAIVRDYTDVSELNLEASLTRFLADIGVPSTRPNNPGSFLLTTSGVLGYDFGCGGFSVDDATLRVARPGVTIVPSRVTGCIVQNGTGSEKIRNVYGGHIMIGATDNTYDPFTMPSPPFVGGWTSVAPRNRGAAAAPVSVTVASTETDVVVDDPYGAAFPSSYAPYQVAPTFGTGPLSSTVFRTGTGRENPSRVSEFGAAGNQETVGTDTFNPWNVSSANLSLCNDSTLQATVMLMPACFPLSASQPVPIVRELGDDGTNATFYNWQLGGPGGGSISFFNPDFQVAPAGPGFVTLTTSVQTGMFGHAHITLFNDLPLGTVWTATVTTATNGVLHTSHAANVFCPCGKTAATITMNDLANANLISAITFSVDPGNTPFVFGPIFADRGDTSIGGNAFHRVPQAHKRGR